MSSIPSTHHSISLASGLGRVDSLVTAVASRTSSGRRIDRPAVDPTGLGQAAKLESEQSRLRAAEVNIQNGVSRMQVTSGQLAAVSRLVTRLSEISVLGANALQTEADRSLYTTEFRQLQGQLRQIVGGTVAEIGGAFDVDRPQGSFNGLPLFGGGTPETLAIGSGEEERMTLPLIDLRQGAIGQLIRQDGSGSFTTSFGVSDAATLNTVLGAALEQVSLAQAEVGAGQSRLTLAASVATTAAVNHESALSTIVDADVASQTTELARLKILSEGHGAMLVQARDLPAKLISLLARQ